MAYTLILYNYNLVLNVQTISDTIKKEMTKHVKK